MRESSDPRDRVLAALQERLSLLEAESLPSKFNMSAAMDSFKRYVHGWDTKVMKTEDIEAEIRRLCNLLNLRIKKMQSNNREITVEFNNEIITLLLDEEHEE
jgi:hypothetical protein